MTLNYLSSRVEAGFFYYFYNRSMCPSSILWSALNERISCFSSVITCFSPAIISFLFYPSSLFNFIVSFNLTLSCWLISISLWSYFFYFSNEVFFSEKSSSNSEHFSYKALLSWLILLRNRWISLKGAIDFVLVLAVRFWVDFVSVFGYWFGVVNG